MRFIAEPISRHRLSRFHRWAMLWLAWFAAFLEQAGAIAPLSRQAEAIGHVWLNGIERVVLSIVMLRAAPSVRALRARPIHSARRRKDASLRRAVISAALRRTLRPKTLQARIKALSQNLDHLVARLVKRLPRGLTRRRAIKARRTLAPALTAPSGACLASVADTS
ncbi:MAG: hypothetical protein HY054_00655 [Proteobacteria bacterium]|nr:hypothetical protein [Pseudomonadota bacterium]